MTSNADVAETKEVAQCFIGIVDGEVKCAVSASDPKIVRKAISEWMSREPIPDIIRVPVELARAYLFRPWPGLEAALVNAPAEEKRS